MSESGIKENLPRMQRATRRMLGALALILGAPSFAATPGSCTPDAGVERVEHTVSVSYCALCGTGVVHVVISNPYGVDMSNLVLTEDLRASGLTYVPGSTSFVGTYVTPPPVVEPAVSGINGSVLTWDLGSFVLPGPMLPPTRHAQLEIVFNVRRAAILNEEGLVLANRNMEATLEYTSSCAVGTQSVATGLVELPIRQAVPRVTKLGRNVDAAQGGYSDPVYGNTNDDLIWRIQVQNTGEAPMQDLMVSDVIAAGNYVINYRCPTDASAVAVANNNGVAPGGSPCTLIGPTTSLTNFAVDDPYGNPGNDEPGAYVDVATGTSTYLYLVGKLTSSCSNRVNTANNTQWGCEIDNPDGGIAVPASTGGVTPSYRVSDTATLSALVVNNGVQVQRAVTGTNTAQPVGSKGTVTITITNNTGGTVKNLKLRDVLPVEYVMDPTFTPTLTVTPAYGNYQGMTDRITWTNPAPGTVPLTTSDPLVPLTNTAPEFTLYSSTVHPAYADHVNLLRQGDRLVVTFRIVMIRPSYFDKVANLDVREEAPASDPPGTDPTNNTPLSNSLYVDFEQFCNPGVIQHPASYPYVDTAINASPEDLDVDIAGSELIFILTNSQTQPLPLTVEVANRGGHDARDWTAYVSFGATMNVTTVPAGCALTTNPPPLAVWRDPAPIPATARVYQCTGGVIAPGQTLSLAFQVMKSTNPAELALDDLTFRADVVGEVTLSSGAPLWFPAPDTSVIANRANNYSLDGIRARVIGFNLLKSQVGNCTEENPPPASPDSQVIIGEECSYHIDTGGWFGFQTPGFTYIAVQRIQVVDELPNGQGYLRSTDPYATSTGAIAGVSLNPAGLQPLDEGWIDWTFNQVVPGERITQRDEWFRVDLSTRLLNDPVDLRAAPNLHAAVSRNVLNSNFQAVFNNATTGLDEIYDLGPGTIGYPQQVVRRVDLTVTEPNLQVTKRVCNETLYGTGTGCGNFVASTDEGDAYNSYIYRITLTNEASSGGVARAPAYDVISVDTLDASDLMRVIPFESDGLDNDGDGFIDGADTDGEGSIDDNVVNNGSPAQITFSHAHSSALLRVAPGASVTFYYRVDPDDTVAPLQQLVNSVEMSYDSLTGLSGNQSAPQRPTSDAGGARLYRTVPATATVQILPVVTDPKSVLRLANTPLGAGTPQPVAIGEEVEYQLDTFLPVARLRDFVIRDELPAGIRCTEAPVVNLNAGGPYEEAGFVPGGLITPTCTDGVVEWDFGDQQITHGTVDNRYDFAIRFIARVDNSAANNDGGIIRNGGSATSATARYVDEAGNPVTLDFGHVDIQVTEPRIALAKSFDVVNADAGDEVTVTLTATNMGTATAYNLQVFDDIAAVGNLIFLSGLGGLDPPDVVDTTTFGANRPLFRWSAVNPRFAIAPGESVSFTFRARVLIDIEPHTVLVNTAHAAWTSLPDRATALNTSGQIGVDGSVTGMRNGAVPPAGDAINDYETSATASASVPAIVLTKTDLNPAAVPAPGAHKHFQVEVRLPEGTSSNVVATDNLAQGALSYLLADNADFDVTYSFQGIATINGAAPGEAALLAVPADGATGTAIWNIGTVITASEDDLTASAITPLIRIDYHARINNDLTTDAGDTLQNGVTLNYTNATGGTETLTSATPAVTVVEPALTVNKSWANVTPGKAVGDAPDGGDLLLFTVTIPNDGDSTAHDINVVDTLSGELQLDGSFAPTATIGGVAVAGFVATPAGAPAGPLVWGRGNGDNSLDLPAGQSLVLTYQARVATSAEPGTVLSNSVLVDWSSLDGASSYERTGNGCPLITAPDDYCTGPATTTTTVVDTNAITKSILADTYTTAPFSTADDSVVRVGDIVTYQLAVALQEGRTRNVVVQDLLPAGMVFMDIVSVNGDTSADYTPPVSGAGSNFSYAALTAANRPSAGQTGTLTWNLGTVVNDPLGDATTDTLVIVYRARVEPDSGIPHVAETTLTNTATLTYLTASGAVVTPAPRLTSSSALTVRQPILGNLTKWDRSGRVSGDTVNVATDTMNFRIEACNSAGLAPAYSALLIDTLATQLNESSIAGPVNGAGAPDVYINGVLASAGSDYLYTAPAVRGGSWSVRLITPVNPGQCVAVDYDIGFHNDVGANQAWQNSVTLNEYWSLTNTSGQRYGPVGPVHFFMNSTWPPPPAPAKSLLAPLSGEATVGEEIVYRIAVPSVTTTSALYDVVIADTLAPSLRYLSASEVSGAGLTLTDNTVLPGAVSLRIAMIPAGAQAVIELHARVDNNAQANGGVSVGNSASYSYANEAGGVPINGGSGGAAQNVRIVEPSLTLAKGVQNLTRPGLPPDAGDLLRYTLTVSAAGGGAGDNFSDAFDLQVNDTLGLGLLYQGNPTVSGAGNVLGAPITAGDGVTVAQSLRWSPADGNADVDVPEGQTVTVTYDVLVLDGVRANQLLTNSAILQWTGLDGSFAYERDGSATPTWNDYYTSAATSETVADTTTVTKTRLFDTWGDADSDLRIGDLLRYELRVHLNEGTSAAAAVVDTLPQGLRFERTLNINGDTGAPFTAVAPFSHPAIAAPVVAGDPQSGPSTVTWNVGDLINAGDNETGNDDFAIVYLARVVNLALAQADDTPLTNSAAFNFTSAGGSASHSGDQTVHVRQPRLVAAKSAAPAGGDTILDAGELITYTVDLTNTGTAPAYDAVLRDVIPVGLRNGAASVTTVSTTLVNSATVLPNVVPSYDPLTGVATWNFDRGVADAYTIPVGEILRVVYQVQADADLSPGLTLVNQARAELYYSLDDEAVAALDGVAGVREIYGPSNSASVTLTTAAPQPLAKQNPAVTTASVGEPFTYRITVPATPQATALHDVRILDDLTASAADLSFVSVTRVSGSQPWTPVNTGTVTQLVIEDTVNGIEIPAGEQIVIDVTVVLDDSPTNVSGLLFHNTASYTYNQVNGDAGTRAAGGADVTADMTIVGPDSFVLDKSGPATMRVTAPGTFTLDAHNTGSGRAWDLTLTDRLPNPAPGGMCTTAPDNVTARVYQADGVTPVSAALVQGTDFSVAFSGEPACTLTITMQSAAASVGPGERLIVTYRAYLDGDNLNGTVLTNVAGAAQWFSADTAGTGATGAIRAYTRLITDGTVGTLDHEDAHTLTTETSVLEFRKTVINLTTGQDPGANATPGDLLRYRVTVRNVSPVEVSDFTLRDELDGLNASALFAPGTLALITVPAGGDTSLTNPNGGAHGTGLVNVANLHLDAQGGASDSVVLEFQAQLAPVITNGTTVLNQAQFLSASVHSQSSDDPNVNGVDDPQLLGDEDPTSTLIASAPDFRVEKISQDRTSDLAVLMAGDVLRYTITVKNVGTENATGVTLRDPLPPNTSYVANSTRLNGVAVADPSPGVSPLLAGLLINAPEDATAGAMRADATATVSNVATVSFDVHIDSTVVNGTVIANQGFVTGSGAGSGLFPETPSDDPDTATPDDPTRDVVGNVPLVDAQKTVALAVDNGSPGLVDPGDVLRYTITLTNLGAIPATGVTLTDAVPANTAYVADSTFLNGLAVGQPDGGLPPLAAGIAVSSADRTPPLPVAGEGTLSAGGTATVVFDVQVDGAATAGTLISNQGSVTGNEIPAEPTDADGIDSNGDQPTTVVVGNVQQLAITKEVAVVGGGAALAGGQLEYTVRITNIGSVAATHVLITDDLNPLAGLVGYVAGSGTLNGSTDGIHYVAGMLSADYSTFYGTLAPGGTATLRFRVQIDPALAIGTTITNTAQVEWSSPHLNATAVVSIDVGGTPGSAALNGRVWHDGNLNRVAESGELNLADWAVDIYRSGILLGSAATDATGLYRISGLAPGQYEVRFRAPDAGLNTGALGWGDSIYTNYLQRIGGIAAGSGSNLLDINLPLQPDGVVYDAVQRVPVAGATVRLLRAATGMALPAGCFDDAAQQDQVTGSRGYYKFDINFSDPACNAPGAYLIQVTPPATGFMAGPSRIIPPVSGETTAAFDVPGCPGGVDDAVPATVSLCEIQASEFAPGLGVAAGTRGTNHHLHLRLDNGALPDDSQAFNNHIPVDPRLDGAVAITKTAALVNVTRGQLVPYTITVRNTLAATLTDLLIVDTFPAGFKYVEGSARLDGAKVEPVREGRRLSWNSPALAYDVQHELHLLLIVGSGVSEGEYVNRAQLFNTLTEGAASPEAQATVRVVPDPTFDCTDIIGKVFDDANRNGLQDEGEGGLAGVRIISARGLIMTTDEHGRYHITCAAVPDEDRGSNFILKLDDRSLPSGYRVTTENPLVQRATRGKMMKFNFGAAIHRVVNLGIADGVFEADSTAVRLQWQPRIATVVAELRKAPSVLRLSYMADVEDPDRVARRVAAMKEAISTQWRQAESGDLIIETEIFWRRGAPPEKAGAR